MMFVHPPPQMTLPPGQHCPSEQLSVAELWVPHAPQAPVELDRS
jgi:hypothetical protein